MADIREAAQWIKDRSHVRRRYWYWPITIASGDQADRIEFFSNRRPTRGFMLNVDDLLADDWEIAE